MLFPVRTISRFCVFRGVHLFIDVYNMQLSNKPAEDLAKKLVDSSEGAFSHVGFASGGAPYTFANLKSVEI